MDPLSLRRWTVLKARDWMLRPPLLKQRMEAAVILLAAALRTDVKDVELMHRRLSGTCILLKNDRFLYPLLTAGHETDRSRNRGAEGGDIPLPFGAVEAA